MSAAANLVTPTFTAARPGPDRIATLLLRIEGAPLAVFDVRFEPVSARPVLLCIDDEVWALTRAEADDVAQGLFADPMILVGGMEIAARLMEAARFGVAYANDNRNPPPAAVPAPRTGLAGLGLAVVALIAYLAVLGTTVLDAVVMGAI